LNSLASLLWIQGDYAGAKPLYVRALAIREQVLGSNHPDTAWSLNSLALLLRGQEDYTGAQPLYRRALAICEQHLDVDHPLTRTIRANLAALDTPPPSAAQQIADLTAQAEAAVAQALTDPTSDRATLTEQLEEQARWAEDGEAEGSPELALATHLRALAAQLTAPPADESATDSA
jgi:tetratricopeptide (TPR) repeat protein